MDELSADNLDRGIFKLQAENNLNDFMYEVLLDMEDLERNCADEVHAEDHNTESILKFCKKLKGEVQEMDRSIKFEDNLISFCSELEPEEEDILFYDIVVPFYEVWKDSTNDPELMDDEEDRLEANSLVAAGKIIIEILDDYLGYDYFEEKEVS